MATVQVAAITATMLPPSSVRVAGIGAQIDTSISTRVQVAGVSASMSVPATVQVAGVAAQMGGPRAQVRVAGLSAVTIIPTTLDARAGADQFINAFTVATLNGAGSTGAVALWDWAQIGGPTVQIFDEGPIRTYEPIPAQQGYDLIFRLSVTDGSQVDTDDVTHHVHPWWHWVLLNGTWTAQPMYLIR